jgi:hypothetical protein
MTTHANHTHSDTVTTTSSRTYSDLRVQNRLKEYYAQRLAAERAERAALTQRSPVGAQLFRIAREQL